MRFRPSVACAALALGALLPSSAPAQAPDAFVLPFGMLRLELQGMHNSFDSYYDADGNRVRAGSELSGDLAADRFAPLTPLAANLSDFLAVTAGGPGASPEVPDPSAISLGLLDVTAAAARTEGRARISIGVLPRLEIGASLPLGRGDRLVQRLRLEDGTVGFNPDADGNRDLLAEIGWAPLGDSPLLPTADSPMGIELQNRVQALTGRKLALPENPALIEPLETLLLDQYGFAPLASRLEQWRLGDLHLEARGLVLSSFGNAPVPVEAVGVHGRLSVNGGLRLPTGRESDTVDLFLTLPAERISEFDAGAAADLFLGERLWVTGSLSRSWPRDTEITRRIVAPGAPFAEAPEPEPVTYSPASRTAFTVTPRVRLNESISFDLSYGAQLFGDTHFRSAAERDASVLDLEGGTLQQLGIGLRYSSLPAYWVRQARLPADVSIHYSRVLAGPDGAPAGGRVTVRASILPRLW